MYLREANSIIRSLETKTSQKSYPQSKEKRGGGTISHCVHIIT
jgi:hypothetical protein